MFLDPFFVREGHSVRVSREQASDFAKTIADDFNPLHDADAKRFCVPGDLLFSLLVMQYGLSANMSFNFTGMVNETVNLQFEAQQAAQFALCDEAGKAYVEVSQAGAKVAESAYMEAFIRQYVAFSGHNFPHILVPLMREQGVMINPARPMVMYQSMTFELDVAALNAKPELSLSKSLLSVDGKRGDVELQFAIAVGSKVIGHGSKALVLSGLRPYEASAMQAVCDRYSSHKAAYLAA